VREVRKIIQIVLIVTGLVLCLIEGAWGLNAIGLGMVIVAVLIGDKKRAGN